MIDNYILFRRNEVKTEDNGGVFALDKVEISETGGLGKIKNGSIALTPKK